MYIKKKNVRNSTFSFIACNFVFSFWLSYFLLNESSHQKVYDHVGELNSLCHLCTSTGHLLDQVVEGNNCWDHEVFSVTALLVSHNNLDLGWNTTSDLWDSLHHNIDCLIDKQMLGVFPSNYIEICSLTLRMCIMSGN